MDELNNNKFDRPGICKFKACASYLITLVAVSVIVMGAMLTQQFFEERLRQEKGELLTVILEQTQNLFLEWAEERQKEVASWAQTYLVRQSVLTLLELPETQQELQASVAQEVLREILSPLLEGRELHGYFLIGRSKVNLASSRDSNIGETSVIAQSYLDRAFSGESLITLPQRSKVSLPSYNNQELKTGQPTMFSLAPVKAENGDVVAVLAFRLAVLTDFSRIFTQANIGYSGDTYAFNKAGQLQTNSRFTEQLWDLGLVDLNAISIFNLELRDPGGNMVTGYHPDRPRLEQPLTLMAKQAIQGKDGINLQGYNDYRGVPVIGAWAWNDRMGLGFATEIDVEEVYATLMLSRSMMIVLSLLSIVIVIALNVVFELSRKRVAKTETSLLNAQSIAHLGSWDRDITNNQLEWSDECYRIFKQDPEKFEPSYESFMDIVHPDDRENVASAINDALNGGKPYYVEHRVECPDGSERIVLQQAIIERDMIGKPTYMHGSALDITDRKKAEQELTLFKTTADMVEDSLLMFNPDSLKFFYVNQATIQQLGYSEEELFNMTPLDIMPELGSESFHASIDSLIKGTNKTLQYQTVHQCKDGRLIPVDIALKYLAPKDEDARFVAIARDFSERQKIENQLKAEKEKAEQATRTKSEFLANMSHEIRTPMNGVLGMLELLAISQVDAKQKSYLSTAESSAQLLLTLINDILDFSKIEAGRMELESTVFNLHKIVEDSVISMSKQSATKKLALNCYISPEAPTFVMGDPVRLRQIIVNLINNAIKFTATGEVNFRAGLLSEKGDQVSLCFEVEDTGIGIEEEKINTLFDAFSQADGSTTRKYGGTGLGLTICKQLVSMMGGDICVSSKPGSGSIFSFSAVFSKVESRVELERKEMMEGLRVLVVDDNETSRVILSHYLSNWNIKNTGISDAYAVLPTLRDAVANNKPYHVILLDFLLPKIDGQMLAKKIKAEEELKNIGLIMLSSPGERDYDAFENSSHIDSHLSKPARQSDLFDALLQVTGQIEKRPIEKRARRRADVLFTGARVLLVDDVATNQAVGGEMLNELGIEPVLANNGREALNEIKSTDFDLVLMDCQMPVMDGYAATEIIRAQEIVRGTEHLPIIALTANAMKGDMEACIAAGMDDYMAKPITLDNLRRILGKWLPDEKQHEVVSESSGATYTEDEHPDSKISMADVTDGVLDNKILSNLQQLAGERFGALIDRFEQDVKINLSTLCNATEKNDEEAIVSAAHAMKGAGMSLAATQFSECCRTLEMQAREKNIIDAQGQIKSIENEYQRAIRALKKLC